MDSALLTTLAICFGIQAAFFAVAAALKTDKVTDLSYGLTFIALAAWLFVTYGGGLAAAALAGMVVLWGLRLSAYLGIRIWHMGRDYRFDGVREHFWRFAKFWFFQGLAVWLIMLPVTLWFSRNDVGSRFSFSETTPDVVFRVVGLMVWAIGLVIEAVADQQKFAHKKTPGVTWTDVGLWRVSRHPNYFGELLCWWGVFVFAAGQLTGLDVVLGLVGPLSITGVLLFLTGIPPLEESAEKKWGSDPAYVAYKQRTNVLVPWPRTMSLPRGRARAQRSRG